MRYSTTDIDLDATPEEKAEAIELIRALVATPSVSGDEERAVRLLISVMGTLGFRTSIDGAGNAVGEVGADDPDAPEIVLLGHIDTVPGDIPVRIENGVLWGRGSVDAKGPLAAFVMAGAAATLPEGMRLAVIGAVGEEAPHSPGATFVRDRRRPCACIIGEPSSWDRFTVGYKGRLLVEATFSRAAAHSSGPEATAPERAVAWWNSVRTETDRLNEGREGAFDTLQATLQRINSTADGLAETAVAQIGFRLPTWIAPDELEARVRAISGVASLRFDGAVPAIRADRSGDVAQALSSAIAAAGGRPRAVVKTGTSDMNVVAPAWNCPIAAYGPGDSALDHTPDERLDLEEYLRSIRVLQQAIETLASRITGEDP